jgi:hypothetical protein
MKIVVEVVLFNAEIWMTLDKDSEKEVSILASIVARFAKACAADELALTNTLWDPHPHGISTASLTGQASPLQCQDTLRTLHDLIKRDQDLRFDVAAAHLHRRHARSPGSHITEAAESSATRSTPEELLKEV